MNKVFSAIVTEEDGGFVALNPDVASQRVVTQHIKRA